MSEPQTHSSQTETGRSGAQEKTAPAGSRCSPGATQVTLCTLHKPLIRRLEDSGLSSFLLTLRDTSICLSGEKPGATKKKDFGFCPVAAFRLSSEELRSHFDEQLVQSILAGEGSGSSCETKFEVRKSTGGCGMDLRVLDVAETGLAGAGPAAVICNALSAVGQLVSSHYAKYFANNCIIVNASSAFESEEAKKLCRESCYSFVEANIQLPEPEKSAFDQYLENFDLRPFYGPALLQLPTWQPEVERYDWDHLYINAEQTAKELGLSSG